MQHSMSAYAYAGVDYTVMDPFKVLAQQLAGSTVGASGRHTAKEVPASRGESAYVWKEGSRYRAFVVEGLGTKSLVADAVREITHKTYYDALAQDTVAMIVNDLITVGAFPQVLTAYFAVGDSAWFDDEARARQLLSGWAKACVESGAIWGGGETPTLKDIISKEAIDLAGSAVGTIPPKQLPILGDTLTAGDAIVLIASSGIHANGITLVRRLADRKPGFYAATLPDGRLMGEALLTPTRLYVALVRSLLKANVPVHYMVNITGHGWRKLMRATKAYTYRIDSIPEPPAELVYLQEQASLDDTEMYSTFNMGAGFALFMPEADVPRALAVAMAGGYQAWMAGRVIPGQRQVIIEPKHLAFASDSLRIR